MPRVIDGLSIDAAIGTLRRTESGRHAAKALRRLLRDCGRSLDAESRDALRVLLSAAHDGYTHEVCERLDRLIDERRPRHG
ncbi:MAG: hypothetical protein KF768_13455 [Phycisphaeraceae bacterium]|nr:hypothetical protein [Phycisphaeraceae bacterium]